MHTSKMSIMAEEKKVKCDRSKQVGRAQHGVTKFIKEVDEIIGSDTISSEAIDHLKVIHQQLDLL